MASETDPSHTSTTESKTAERLALLKTGPLTALMRATWTWDDRALRRDLADVLVAARASELQSTTGWSDPAWQSWHDNHTVTLASHFVRAVLGSHLLTRDLAGAEPFFALAQLPPGIAGPALNAAAVVEAFQSRTSPRADLALQGSLAEIALAAYTAAVEGPNGTGRGLADTALAAGALRWIIGSSEADALLKEIEAGGSATLAVAERLGTWDPALVRTRAETSEDGTVHLTGEKRVVPYVSGSETVLVMARTTAGPTLYAVDPMHAGVTIATTGSTNPDAPFSSIKLDQVPAVQIGSDGTGGRTMARLLDTASVIMAAEQIGHAERAIETVAAQTPENEALPHLVASWAAATVLLRDAVEAIGVRTDNGVAAGMSHIAATRASRAATGHALAAAGEHTNEHSRRDRADALDLLLGGPAASHERLLERMDI